MAKAFSRIAFGGVLPMALASMVLVSCSSDRNVAGGTEAESTIALQVQLADGRGISARVRALPEGYLPQGDSAAGWISTDEKGFVSIAVEPGRYIVESRGVDGSQAVGAVVEKTVDASDRILADTIFLERLSTIEGLVTSGQGPSVVRIPGLERFVVPDSAGRFVIDSLPPGDFSVYIESRSNRGSVTVEAASGDTVPDVDLGKARGFVVEDFESFSGISYSGRILGDGWWYSLASDGQLAPLWEESLTKYYSGSEGCASGGCVRTANRMGVLLGLHKADYALPEMDTLMFAARGTGTLTVSVAYGDGDEEESGFSYEIDLSKVWQGYAIALADMKPYGKAKSAADGKNILASRIDFQISRGDSVYLDDIALGGITEEILDSAIISGGKGLTDFSANWNVHDSLLKESLGYGEKTCGASCRMDSDGKITSGERGDICLVTALEDSVSGSLRSCVEKEGPVWILFEKNGNYKLSSPLFVTSDKTIDGRGRDIVISGAAVSIVQERNVILENLWFAVPVIAEKSSHLWVDHCQFTDAPEQELDLRNSSNVTVSWSRFENGKSGIVFTGIADGENRITVHHNYFGNLEGEGLLVNEVDAHLFNNDFNEIKEAGFRCSEGARCYADGNVFNVSSPADVKGGSLLMKDSWFISEGNDKAGDAKGFVPDYSYTLDKAGTDLVWCVVSLSGIR